MSDNLPARRRAGYGGPIVLVLVMWAVMFVDAVLPASLVQYGIQPRSGEGLVGIVTAPFLHGSFAHLLANATAFVILGLLVAATSKQYWSVTLGVMIMGGLAVWLIGAPNTVHVGASGLVYGYAAFLLAWGLFTRSWKNILVAVLVAVLYGGLVFGLLPTDSRISWEGHLFGAVAGVVMAYSLSRRRRPAITR